MFSVVKIVSRGNNKDLDRADASFSKTCVKDAALTFSEESLKKDDTPYQKKEETRKRGRRGDISLNTYLNGQKWFFINLVYNLFNSFALMFFLSQWTGIRKDLEAA